MTSRLAARVGIVLLLTTTFALAGCRSQNKVEFVPNGAPTSTAAIEKAAQKIDLSAVADVDVADAPRARTDALVWLRGEGATGVRAATLLTRGFPDRTAAVPVYVEAADVDGVRSIIVVEAFGGQTGPLAYRRLWIFDFASGRLLLSTSYR